MRKGKGSSSERVRLEKRPMRGRSRGRVRTGGEADEGEDLK